MADPAPDRIWDEYAELQKIITGINEMTVEIKKWGITFSLGALGLAYTEHTRELLLVSSASALAFWLTESYWRANQWVFIERVRLIEKAAEAGRTLSAPRISLYYAEHWGPWRALRQTVVHLMNLRTLLPHAFVVIAGIVLFFAHPPAPAKAPAAAAKPAALPVP
jgi:hypothetical protein